MPVESGAGKSDANRNAAMQTYSGGLDRAMDGGLKAQYVPRVLHRVHAMCILLQPIINH